MQAFQKRDAVVAGTDEAIGMLKLCLTEGYDFADLEVRSLRDGDRAGPWETVMLITGPYPAFVHLETLCAGRAGPPHAHRDEYTRAVVEAAWPKPIMFFPARHDHWRVQTGDGWAAHVAGAIGVSTDAQASWWGSSGIGTVPHGLIAALRRRHGGRDGWRSRTSLAGRGAHRLAGRFRQRQRGDHFAGGGPRARGAVVGRAARHLGHDGRPFHAGRDGRFRPAGRELPAGAKGEGRAGRGEGFGHVRIVVSGGFERRQDPRVRGGGRAG